MENWEDISDWYDKKQGETGDFWHRTLIDPALLRIIGDCRDKEILDLGCGNGYLARRLARDGARVTAVDSSLPMIKNAKAHDPEDSLKIKYVHTNANQLDTIADESFYLVFANMSLMDIEDAEGAVREVSRVLRKGGRFVASISHPCFDNGSNSGWIVEKILFQSKVYRRIRVYRKPFSENIPWRLGSNERKYTRSFHRPLNWYARVLRDNGLAIMALEEPEPTEEFLSKDEDSLGFLEVPLHLVIEAIKL
ncbi:MAG: class I SAM-dependent methyltransferase [Nitrososphaerales archaeon]